MSDTWREPPSDLVQPDTRALLPSAPESGPVPTGTVSRQGTRVRAAATAAEAARPAPATPFHWFGRTVLDVVRKADRDRLLGLSAETAFFAVLTLFPALLAATTVLGQLSSIVGSDNAARVREAVIAFLDTLLTDTARPVIETVEGLFEGSGNALTLSLVLALVALSTAFSTVINTVNIAYDVPETRGWWRRRWLGLLLGVGTVLTGAVAVTLLVIGPLFGRAVDVVERVGLSGEYAFLWHYLRWPTAFLALVLWATTLDHLTPARRSRWRDDLPGGLLTAVLWLAASLGLNVYLQVVVPRSPLLGALGGGLILLTWFYLLAASLLLGAELNAILLARRRHRAAVRAVQRGEDAPTVTLPAAGAREERSGRAAAREAARGTARGTGREASREASRDVSPPARPAARGPAA